MKRLLEMTDPPNVFVYPGVKQHSWRSILRTARSPQCERFFADNVYQRYWHDGKEDWNLKDVPCVAPQFANMWIEGYDPVFGHFGSLLQASRNTQKKEEMIDIWRDSAFGWNRHMKKFLTTEEGEWLITVLSLTYHSAYVLAEHYNTLVCFPPVIFTADTLGRAKGDETVDKIVMGSLGAKTIDPEMHGPHFASIPALLTISFLHCKNVITETKYGGKRATGIAKRRRGYTYKLLKVGQTMFSKEQHGKHNPQGLFSMHICRGHFKDYRENGLFGKYPGIYWCPSHIRGNPEMGIVEKDYEVM